MSEMRYKLKYKMYVNKINSYISQIDTLLQILDKDIIYDPEKEKKHRPIAQLDTDIKQNHGSNDVEMRKIQHINFDDTNDKFKLTINYATKTKKQQKYKMHEYIHSKPYSHRNQCGYSLFKINVEDEKNRLKEKYIKEKIFFIQVKIHIMQLLNESYKYYLYDNYWACDVIDYYNIDSRIKILNGNDDIINSSYFGKKVDYDFCIFFSPPMNDLSMYTIYNENENEYAICNTYVIVHNSSNAYHMFYGYYPFIKCEKSIEQNLKEIKGKKFKLDDLLNCLYQGFIQQPINKAPMIKSIKMIINDNIEFLCEQDDCLYNSFCGFLRLYLKSLIPHDNFTISRIDLPTTHQNYTGLKISINIDKVDLKIKHKNNTYLVNDCAKKTEIINHLNYWPSLTNNEYLTNITSIYENTVKCMYNIYIIEKYEHSQINDIIKNFLYKNNNNIIIRRENVVPDAQDIETILDENEYVIVNE
jgi:hypothetical protein